MVWLTYGGPGGRAGPAGPTGSGLEGITPEKQKIKYTWNSLKGCVIWHFMSDSDPSCPIALERCIACCFKCHTPCAYFRWMTSICVLSFYVPSLLHNHAWSVSLSQKKKILTAISPTSSLPIQYGIHPRAKDRMTVRNRGTAASRDEFFSTSRWPVDIFGGLLGGGFHAHVCHSHYLNLDQKNNSNL